MTKKIKNVLDDLDKIINNITLPKIPDMLGIKDTEEKDFKVGAIFLSIRVRETSKTIVHLLRGKRYLDALSLLRVIFEALLKLMYLTHNRTEAIKYKSSAPIERYLNYLYIKEVAKMNVNPENEKETIKNFFIYGETFFKQEELARYDSERNIHIIKNAIKNKLKPLSNPYKLLESLKNEPELQEFFREGTYFTHYSKQSEALHSGFDTLIDYLSGDSNLLNELKMMMLQLNKYLFLFMITLNNADLVQLDKDQILNTMISNCKIISSIGKE